MQKVITINLNGVAYQLDESGYDVLREYLARAEHQLRDNPDRAEILADLEQAIADKCHRYLGPHKTVVTGSEIDQIVAEMGPVAAVPDQGAASEHAGAGSAGSAAADEAQKQRPKRLFRILDGAMIAGVCTGLASYLQIDVTIMRVIFVAAAFLTHGVAILGYIVMMFLVPEAKTPAERAAAGGVPFNAKEVVERVKQQYAEGSRQFRRQWRRQQREWRRHGFPPAAPFAYGPPPIAALLLPVFGLVHVALFLAMAAATISLVNTGEVLEWQLPPGVPLWAGVLILFVAYQILVSPLRAAQHWTSYPRPGADPTIAFWNAVAWLIGLTFMIWIASNHVPEIREFLQRLPELFREFGYAIRDAFGKR